MPADEIIVVDDGSTDGSAGAVEARYGSRVQVVTQRNSGVAAARNLGIRQAQGEWIAFLDSDDVWLPEKLERQCEAISTCGVGSALCFTDNLYSGNPDMLFSRFVETSFGDASRIGLLSQPVDCILSGREPFFTSSLMIRRALLLECGGFDEQLVIREDTDLVFRLAYKTAFSFVGVPLVRIDRTPSRELGLCKMYGTRDDRVYLCTERMYRKWLAMPEVDGSGEGSRIRGMFVETLFESVEAKLHLFRIRSALAEMSKLHAFGVSYPAIFVALVSRKIAKLRRSASRRRLSRVGELTVEV